MQRIRFPSRARGSNASAFLQEPGMTNVLCVCQKGLQNERVTVQREKVTERKKDRKKGRKERKRERERRKLSHRKESIDNRCRKTK